MAEKQLLLVDGSFYLYRAYHAFPPLTNHAGEPTGAIYGVVNMLKSLLMQYRTSQIAVVFDAYGKTFRDELFEHYKSHRPIMPNDLCCQISPLYEIVRAMGLPLLVVTGVESDDVIGTLAREAACNGSNVLISTGDKDMAQLVSSQITLINTISNTVLGPKEVQLKFGVPPELIIDYLALIGDNSDNIPGVPGVGKKTAQLLLQQLGSLKLLYQNLHNVSHLSNLRGAKQVAAKLEQNREVAFLSYQLATIKTNVTLDIPYHQLIVKEPNYKALMLLFRRYDFKRWIIQLELGKWRWLKRSKHTIAPPFTKQYCKESEQLSKTCYKVIYQITELEQWITEIRRVGLFAFNTETSIRNRDYLTGDLVGLCFAVQPGKAAYLPIGHNDLNAPNQLDCRLVLAALKPVLEDITIAKIGHNFKFNYHVLKRYNINLVGMIFDTMLESYVLDSVSGKHDIESLAEHYLKYTTIKLDKIVGIKRNQLTFNQIPIKLIAPYAAEYADIMLRLHHKLWPRLKEVLDLQKIFQEIEVPLIPVLSRLEKTGVMIDQNMLMTYSIEFTKRLWDLEVAAYKLAKQPFNLSSTKQLQLLLYEKHKLPILKKTPRGAPSTNEEVLVVLAQNYPLAKLILEYRCLAKLKSTYIDKLQLMINKESKRVHTSYHQAITTTGRLSSSSPNLQNIPIRYEVGRCIRQAFIAPPDFSLVVADYSQIELRILAHISRDPGLLSAFSAGKDIHSATAAEVFNISLDDVTQDQRQRAKAINFGLIYGMSAFGLARQLSVPLNEAQKYIKFYFTRYPYVLEYMERIRKQAREQGYVSTIDGRRLYLPEINSCNYMRKRSAERAAINAPMQGTAADIIKRAMIAIDRWLQKEAPPVCMIMQVHDELVFEVQRNVVENATVNIRALMESCFPLDVPLEVNIKIGDNWDKVE
ncbi:DNA polymerase I [Candidatus Palibaumannia cicadellinicola]|uniref:DNA polymerase I n=2 Tax=Candidatus Palibaumannia cicadellinicola TaxID=186490 RepID=A0A088NA38_9GAMM|nr:DNA polymerase I [Candidatus Baumannia cicadellinicola]